MAQNKSIPILERKVTIVIENDKLPAVLARIALEKGFSFSYNAQLIDPLQSVSVNVKEKTVREILNQIFKGSVNYKEKGNHLILTKVPPAPKKVTTVLIISGYVEDENTGQKIADASVYDKSTLSSAITDAYGFYKIKLDPDKNHEPVQLSVSKDHYRDTLIMVSAAENQYITIAIRPLGRDSLKITASAKTDTIVKPVAMPEELQLPFDDEANVRNIKDTLHRDIQVSILPFVGMNGKLSGNIINDYSINFFGGYSMGTRRIELGFFFNADRGDVSFLQIAGFGNVVGRNVYGAQAAGFFNVNGGEVKAGQLAGFTNFNLGEARGVQVSGFANINAKSADGVLVSGFGNIVNGKSEGMQVAGFANIQKSNYKGSQVAGFTNIASGDINGSQISGFFNFGRKVKGSQIALINYADSMSGVPIGLMSFVKSGYHKLEISADEIFYTNLAFRTGVRQFYNIINVGIKPEYQFGNSKTVWTFGYGLGTAPKLNRWLSLNFDLSSNQINQGGFTNSLSLLNKFYAGFDVRLARKFSITFGATLNGYLSNPNFDENPVLFTDFSPHVFSDHNISRRVNMKMWFGGKIGLRFL